LVTDPQKMVRAAGKATFKRCEIINSDLVLVESERPKITLNKPVAIGFTILEFAKLVMCEFYYDCLLPKFGNKLHLALPKRIPSYATSKPPICSPIWRTYQAGLTRPTSTKTIFFFWPQTNESLANSNRKPATVCPKNFAV